MDITKTTLLSAVSALAWNSILLYLGYVVGDNWRVIGDYLGTYSKIVTAVVVAALLGWLLIRWLRARRNGTTDNTPDNKA